MLRRIAILAVLGLVAAGCSGNATKSSTPPAPPASTSAGQPSACPTVTAPKSRSENRKAPTSGLDASKTWTARVETSCGSFTIRLDVEDSPHTTASFVSLARSGFYDDTTFHRIVPGFVIQGGDPTATGGGGPGYSVVDRPPSTATYPRGAVAMAKTPTEPAGTSGSQFFVVTGDASFLTPDYALLGTVVKGMRVAEKIGTLGQHSEAGTPTQVVVIRRITISST